MIIVIVDHRWNPSPLPVIKYSPITYSDKSLYVSAPLFYNFIDNKTLRSHGPYQAT
jgi:hypothetical protein